MARVNEIRSGFLDFFHKNDHEIVPSGPLVPRNDPTLMFTNSGMVQFKNVFTGAEKRPYKRATSAQKCVRAGGKHNDLDNVGYTARHHTFFEMLGNFSFGDYFKDRAIELAWTLITREFAIDPKRLLVTVYADDDEAFALWRKIAGLPEQRIIRIATSDNFWSMGETGPCGPCSEIFYDHGEEIPGGPPGSPEEEGDRFIEIWNLVFMQYEQISKTKRVDLPHPSIDTGMGLERIAAVLQGKHDNYDIDLMRALIDAAVEVIGVPATGAHAVSFRVIADHLRAMSFLIADGVLPSNEGRGYVLRRIMRRAMRHAHLLGAEEPVIYRLVRSLVGEMGQAYPELPRAEALISETIKLEESRFMRTLARGLQLLSEASAPMRPGDVLPGKVAFKLYDTYGFPLDLTEDALKAKGLSVDLKGFEEAMAHQRAEARKAWAGSGEAATETLWFELRERLGATEFLGYDTEHAEGEIVALVKGGKTVKQLRKGDDGAIIVNQTPFYGEAGGQIGDRGVVTGAKGSRFLVSDTQKKLGDLIVHFGHVEKGPLRVGDAVTLDVDEARRAATRASHSATHILHQALRLVLGEHVAQKGSLVEPGRLRFDFSHPKALTEEELRAVEDIANAIVAQNAPVSTRLMGVDEAVEAGALALFGEKYGEEVRVVSMGEPYEGEAPHEHARANGQQSSEGAARGKTKAVHGKVKEVPAAPPARPYSVELCGGTHARRTGDIGLIRIVNETAVAAGVRRIEALTGEAARRYLRERDVALRHAAELLKTTPEDFPDRLQALVEERRKLARDLTEARKKLALSAGAEGGAEQGGIRQIGPVKLLGRAVKGIPPKDLRGLVDAGKRQIGSGVVAIIGLSEDGKAGIVVGVTEDLTEQYDAVDLVRHGAEALGGRGGGGRRDMAQAGGPDGARAQAALDAIAERLGEEVGV